MNESYIDGLFGGMLIGAAAVILYWFNGRIMGVSGMVSRLFEKPNQDMWWRLAFISGLVFGGIIFHFKFPVIVVVNVSEYVLVVAGFLVGFGTVMGNGCTSGHGICGIARLSKRSIVATLVFMTAGILVVFIKGIWGG